MGTRAYTVKKSMFKYYKFKRGALLIPNNVINVDFVNKKRV